MKRWSRITGSAFAVLITGVVLYLYGGDLSKVDFANAALLSGMAGSVAIYVGVILIGALTWRVLLRAFGATPAPFIAERQLLVSQIGKYVPGNFAQYLGRAAMAVTSGIPAQVVGLALITETAVILFAGFLSVGVSVALFPDLTGTLRPALPDAPDVLWLALAVAAFFILLLGARLASTLVDRIGRVPKVRIGGVLLAGLFSTLSFLLLGVSLHLIVAALSSTHVPISLSVAVFAIAWIAGLATPGAPGGIGVRESVIALGLSPLIGGAAALSAALLHRGVSVIGDLISFGLGLLLPIQREAPFGEPLGEKRPPR